MGITQWSIKNFRGINERQTITLDLAPDLFLITGDELASDPGFIANNILVIQNMTSELDRAILYCGTGRNSQEANFTLRLYRRFLNAISDNDFISNHIIIIIQDHLVLLPIYSWKFLKKQN